MFGWCTEFIPEASRALKASSPLVMSAMGCSVRLAFWGVVAMRAPFLPCRVSVSGRQEQELGQQRETYDLKHLRLGGSLKTDLFNKE